MGFHAGLQPDDVVRLMMLVVTVSARLGCRTGEAIDMLERSVDTVRNTRQRPSIFEYAKRMRQLRLRRNDRLRAPLFRDPSWEMLLELLVARGEGRQVSVSSLCYASGAPPTTALRHINLLVQHGLIHRSEDCRDRRNVMLNLADDAAVRLTTFLRDLQKTATG